MRKVYVWKVLSEDGLLKDHHEVGYGYNITKFSEEYESEQKAVEAYEVFKDTYRSQVESKMVLLTIYKTY